MVSADHVVDANKKVSRPIRPPAGRFWGAKPVKTAGSGPDTGTPAANIAGTPFKNV